MALDYNLMEIVACPVCKGKLYYDKQQDELICKFDRLAFPVNDGIPVLIEEQAREMAASELPK